MSLKKVRRLGVYPHNIHFLSQPFHSDAAIEGCKMHFLTITPYHRYKLTFYQFLLRFPTLQTYPSVFHGISIDDSSKLLEHAILLRGGADESNEKFAR